MISASWCRRLRKSVVLRASIRQATRPEPAAVRFAAAALVAQYAAAPPASAARKTRAAVCSPARV
jgi:hypothetical protein